jgi:branched-chain amino acid aminotransferase
MANSEHIWLDGALVPWADARIHVTAHSLHYGSGAFEGIRAYSTPRGAAILQLHAHVRRLLGSCRVLQMALPYDEQQVADAILATVRANRHGACYIRPIVFRGEGPLGVLPHDNPIQLAIMTTEWGALHGKGALEDGVDVGFSSWRRMAPDTHPSLAKATGNYLNSMLVVLEAKRHGYAEGLVLDVEGYLSEGSGENVFLVRDGELLTPPIGNSILAGITRGMVLQLARELGIPTREVRIPRELVDFCDEVFMTGTAAEITPVRSVDKRPVGAGRPGAITRRLQERFFDLVQGRAEDVHGWLTHVD